MFVDEFLDVVVKVEAHSSRAVSAADEEVEGFAECSLGIGVVGLHLRGKMLS